MTTLHCDSSFESSGLMIALIQNTRVYYPKIYLDMTISRFSPSSCENIIEGRKSLSNRKSNLNRQLAKNMPLIKKNPFDCMGAVNPFNLGPGPSPKRAVTLIVRYANQIIGIANSWLFESTTHQSGMIRVRGPSHSVSHCKKNGHDNEVAEHCQLMATRRPNCLFQHGAETIE